MTAQRYVFVHRAKSLEYYRAEAVRRWEACKAQYPDSPYSKRSAEEVEAEAAASHRYYLSLDGKYAKAGGHVTADLQEAQLVGWKSNHFRNRSDGELVKARIVLE